MGTPVGTPEFVEDVTQRRLEEESRLWEAIPSVPDLQSAWRILLQCAGPVLRTLPPSVSASEDDGGLALWLPGDPIQKRVAHTLHADGRFGSEICIQDGSVCVLGFVGDAMPMISERLPEVANRVELQLAMEDSLSDPWVNFKRQL